MVNGKEMASIASSLVKNVALLGKSLRSSALGNKPAFAEQSSDRQDNSIRLFHL